jgi:hypothetical protein
MEHNTRKTLPERSQQDYWEFITEYPSTVSSYGTYSFSFVWNLHACSLKFNSKLLGDTGAMPEFVRIPV